MNFVLRRFKDQQSRRNLRDYLDKITRDEVSDKQLKALWWSSSADIVFYDGASLRVFLKRIRDRL